MVNKVSTNVFSNVAYMSMSQIIYLPLMCLPLCSLRCLSRNPLMSTTVSTTIFLLHPLMCLQRFKHFVFKVLNTEYTKISTCVSSSMSHKFSKHESTHVSTYEFTNVSTNLFFIGELKVESNLSNCDPCVRPNHVNLKYL